MRNTENGLLREIEDNKMEKMAEKQLKDAFLPFFEKAEEWKKKAESIVVTSVDQKEEIKQARKARLALKDIRVEADKVRKSLKEDSIRKGKAIQGVYNVIDYLVRPIEEHLQNQEDFAKNEERKRRAKLKDERESELQDYREFVPFGIDVSDMEEADFQKVLNGAKMQLNAKIEAEKEKKRELAESLRLDHLEQSRKISIAPYAMFNNGSSDLRNMEESAFTELLSTLNESKIRYENEQEIIRAENERLLKEKEERDKIQKQKDLKAKKERQELQRKIDEKEAIEKARLKAIEDENQRVLKLKAETLKKGDKAILADWLLLFPDAPAPSADIKSSDAKVINKRIIDKYKAFTNWAKLQISEV